MGVAQHHQAITGTSKQNVADDHVRRLQVAMEQGRIVSDASLK